MTHSPAPWTVFQDPMRRWTIGNATHRICDMWGKDPAFYTAEDEANARLIAAAPDLLDALIECVSELEGVGWGGAGYTDLAHAAIAAATGVPCNPELLSPAATADKATKESN